MQKSNLNLILCIFEFVYCTIYIIIFSFVKITKYNYYTKYEQSTFKHVHFKSNKTILHIFIMKKKKIKFSVYIISILHAQSIIYFVIVCILLIFHYSIYIYISHPHKTFSKTII